MLPVLQPAPAELLLLKAMAKLSSNLETVLARNGTDLRLFGKPVVHGHRRMAVLLARDESVDKARAKTADMLSALTYEINQ